MNSISHLKLCDIASHPVLSVTPETPLKEAVGHFADKHVSSLVVVEDGRPVGIVTERDLVRLMCIGSADRRPVRAVMSAPLTTVPCDLDFSTAQVMMANCGIRHLVLVDAAGQMQGVVSETDFRRHLGTDLLALMQSLNSVVDTGGKMIAPDRPLAFALETMASYKLDHVIVGRDGLAEGIVTERDVPGLLARQVDAQAVTLGEVMTRPLATIRIDASIDEAVKAMDVAGLRHLVVVDGAGGFLGVVSQHRMLEKLGVAMMGKSRAQLEDRMSMVLEATGIRTWEYDNAKGNLVRSVALADMPGSSGLLTESLDDVLQRIDAEDRQHLTACFNEVLLGRAERFAVDCRLRGADGKTRWISSRGKVVERDAEGRPLRSAGVAIDISAQKATEEELRKSEARFRGLMEKIPLAIGHVNARQEIVFTNAQFEAMFGYGPADVPNLAAWWQLAYPDADYRARVRAAWEEAVREAAESGGTLHPLEFRVTRKDGGQRLIEISGIALGEDFLAIFIDVTERRRQQALLEFSNAILHCISVETRLVDILEFIVRQIQSREPGALCSVLLLDDSGQHLTQGAAPDLPKAYSAAIEGVAIGPSVGSCGTAAFRREPVFVGDIASDPRWGGKYRRLALDHGLAACWSSPIFSTAGKVLGTFAVYWPEPRREVSLAARRYVEAATTLVALAIESSRRESELRSRIEELRRWQQATLGREGRVIELKREVNELLARLGEGPRYASVTGDGGAA